MVATGHYRNGILLTPITADAVAAAVAGEELPPEVAPCDPTRFASAPGPDLHPGPTPAADVPAGAGG